MKKPKLIFLNGFAASGKTTLTSLYLKEHKFALGAEVDVLIAMLGQWKENMADARLQAYKLMDEMVKNHLRSGYDVVLPVLLTDAAQALRYEDIAQDTEADFYELYLEMDKEEALRRLFERGVWGEEGLPPLSDESIPEAKKLYEDMEAATKERPNIISIEPKLGAIDETYQELLSKIA
jgi:thymidylate kinase